VAAVEDMRNCLARVLRPAALMAYVTIDAPVLRSACPDPPSLHNALDELAAFAREQMPRTFYASLVAKGVISGVGLHVDDCRKTFDELSAKGVTFLQEPSDRPYGVEAVLRDNSGNWLVLVEPKQYAPRASD
jgi:glyoxalase/bleomycin resistance protein/dioxygenase superfamily protein